MAGSNAARRVARWVTAVGAGLVTAATGGTPAAAQPDARGARQLADTAALRAELERVNGEELAAVARGDAAGAAALYTADAVLLPPDGRVIRGREAIRSYWASGGGAVITDVRTTTVAAGGGGTTAYLTGEYALTSRGAHGLRRRVERDDLDAALPHPRGELARAAPHLQHARRPSRRQAGEHERERVRGRDGRRRLAASGRGVGHR